MAKGKIVERINEDGSHSWDVIVAYKDNITGKWHHRWKITGSEFDIFILPYLLPRP